VITNVHVVRRKTNLKKKECGVERLLKKQAKIRERLAALKDAESPKQQAQATKLLQKLASITAEIGTLPSAVQHPSEFQAPVDPTQVQGLPVETEFDERQLKEASQKFFEMRKKVHQEQKKMRAMAEVVRALNVLARHGSQVQSPVLVGADQAQLAKTSFIASKQELVLQKQELKQLADFFKQLRKQKKGFTKNSLKKAHRRQCGEFDSKNERFDFQDKVKKHRKDKSEKHMDKAQRKEEKAQKYALKAKQGDFSSDHIEKCKKREEKCQRKAAKYEEKAARKTDDPEKAARKAEKCEERAARKAEKYEEKAARKAEKEKRRHQPEGFGTQVPCVGQQGQY